jgi:cytidyltransferase-like protein
MYKPQIDAFGYTFELPSTPPVRAYVGGTFDLFHLGHVNLFKNTKKHVDEVIVAVNGDEFAETYKRKPILNEDVRLELVRSCKYVDNAFLIKTGVDQPHRIRAAGVKYIVHGDDWTGDSLCEQLCITDEWMKQKNIEFLYLPYTQGICTSDIIKEVQNSNGK